MRSSRRCAAFAVLAMLVVVLVMASPIADSERAPSTATGSIRHDADLRIAAPSVTAASATTPSRRLLSIDSFVGYLEAAQSLAITLLLWIAAAMMCWAFLGCAGLTRRVRAPPFAYAS
jgi:hypothetical protein